MWNLYGQKRDGTRNLVAQFGSEQQLLAYVSWATLKHDEDGYKFEQKTPLTGYTGYEHERASEQEPANVPFNPSPGML